MQDSGSNFTQENKYKMQLILNQSRVTKTGAGLARFSHQSLLCLKQMVEHILVISQSDFSFDNDVSCIKVPLYFQIKTKSSLLRPIMWFFYFLLWGLRCKDPVISTTHHAIPFHRRQIVVVHDLRPFHYPDSWLQYCYFRFILPHTLKKVDAVVTVSNAVKYKLIKKYDLDEKKIYIVPNSVTPMPTNYITKSSFIEDDTINDDPYLLMIGASWFHKNAHEVIENSTAWANNYMLKIICGPGRYKDYLKSLVLKKGLKDRVEFLGNVSEATLWNLISRAKALVYPSLDEGFGIPPLEALSAGTPVVVSDIQVLREVLGPAAIYVKLGCSESWVNAFATLRDPNLLSAIMQNVPDQLLRYSEDVIFRSWSHVIMNTWPGLYKKK